eukprot:8373517-Pyramimonas_sp.AAC.1
MSRPPSGMARPTPTRTTVQPGDPRMMRPLATEVTRGPTRPQCASHSSLDTDLPTLAIQARRSGMRSTY